MKGKTFLNVSSFPPAPQEREERGKIQLSLVLRHIVLGETRLLSQDAALKGKTHKMQAEHELVCPPNYTVCQKIFKSVHEDIHTLAP